MLKMQQDTGKNAPYGPLLKHLVCYIYYHIFTFTKQFWNLRFLNNKL